MSEERDAPVVPDSVVARADALMQRKRVAAVRPPPNHDVPVLTDAILGEDDELPVLTAIESDEGFEVAPEPRLDPALLDKLAQEFTRRVHDRLTAELPCLVESALQSTLSDLTRELERGLIETTEAAIREFLNERRKKGLR